MKRKQKIERFLNYHEANEFLEMNPEWKAISISTMGREIVSALGGGAGTGVSRYSNVHTNTTEVEVLVLLELVE